MALMLSISSSISSSMASSSCRNSVTGVDHAFGDLAPYTSNLTAAQCCAKCSATQGCLLWVLETDSHCPGCCFLKKTVSCTPCASLPTLTTTISVPCTRAMASRVSGNWTCPPTLAPTPPPVGPPLPAPVSQLSARFRNWTYYVGPYDGFVVPPKAGNFRGQTLTDTAVVYEKSEQDTLPGRYRLTYLFFNGTNGANGYEAAIATSDDLLHWSFGKGGDDGNGIALKRSPVPGAYDYGGVTLGGFLFSSNILRGPRKLRMLNGSYWALYGCYPSRAGYEAGIGGQGVAYSKDGVAWERWSETTPVVPGATKTVVPWNQAWSSHEVYQPFLLEVNNTFYDFYNAAGVNQFGASAEESGIATLPAAANFPGVPKAGGGAFDTAWRPHTASPVIRSGSKDAFDANMASDPKIFWDAEQHVYVCFYFGVGGASHGHASILVAFSVNLIDWEKDPTPLYLAGGHPSGIDSMHTHKISIVYDDEGVGYMYYTAVGGKGRGIALLTSKPVE